MEFIPPRLRFKRPSIEIINDEIDMAGTKCIEEEFFIEV